MQVRDRTSNDMWRVLSQLNDRLATPPTSLVMLAGDAVGVLERDAARASRRFTAWRAKT